MSLPDSDNDTVMLEAGDVQDFNSDNILPLPATDLAKIIKWLEPTPYDSERGEYSRHGASHLSGTGTWLTSTQVYQQWRHGDTGLLWIKGIPGSGKSVMAASIIKQLQKENFPVIYFFFRQIIEANHKPIVALRDWLCQALIYSPRLQAKLYEYIKEARSLNDSSPDDLWCDLKMALLDLPKVYCVTDALDEMDLGNDDFLKNLVDLGQWRPKNVKVLMTSRPIARLEISLRPFSIPQIRLEENLVDLDIASYVQHRLRGSSIAKEDWSAIQEAIPGRANGIFLYAKMSLDVFLEPGVDVQEALKALPMDLNIMYDGLLREHARRSNVPSELQLLILQFVTHATRPLRLLELAEMLSTRSEGNRTLKEIKVLVRTACGPLLEVLPDETVSVIHHTFTEFLKGHTRSRCPESLQYPIFQPGPTNMRLAMECLHYMRAGCLDSIEKPKPNPQRIFSPFDDCMKKKIQEVRLEFPFLDYAANNWHKHGYLAEASDENLELFHEALDTFFSETHRYTAWLCVAWPKSEFKDITPINVAAYTGLSRFAEHILSKNVDTDTGRLASSMSWAASYNHGNVIRVLVNHAADPDAELNDGLKPMHLAAKSNNVDAIKSLISAGVSPMTPKTKEDVPDGCDFGGVTAESSTIGHTPLMYACHAGHFETIIEFISHLTKVEDKLQAIHWAAEKGRSSIVELILKQPGIDVNAKLQGKTALLRACESADFKTIRLLINAGADPTVFHEIVKGNTRDNPKPRSFLRNAQRRAVYSKDRGYTALHALCRNSVYVEEEHSEAIKSVKALLQAGADVHAKDFRGLTALHYAFKSSVAWMKPLLEAGADPIMEDDDGDTILHGSSSHDGEALSLLLKSEKVDINKARSKDKMTPLLCRLAVENPNREEILQFLTYGPDVNLADSKGDGPLHLALRGFSADLELVKELLAAGVNPNSKNVAGNTPLHQSNALPSKELLKAFLQAGVDLEQRNNEGQSPLLAQLSHWRNRHDTCKILTCFSEEGAHLNTRDRKGRTLWHYSLDCMKSLSLLKSLGLDPLVSDHNDNTPLHELVSDLSLIERGEKLKLLVEMGMDINQRNHQGRTVLHLVCSRDSPLNRGELDRGICDYALEKSECPTVSDNNGIQPLHLAATISEAFVYKLLNAGADVCAATHDKMTVLHLASRARQPGIVDMILFQVRSFPAKTRLDFVNAQNGDGRTALHYACRSGRPETVKSLLEAGAVVDILDIHDLSPLAMCGEFEKEASLWRRHVPTQHPFRRQQDRGLNSGGLMLKNDTLPFFDIGDHDSPPPFGKIKSEHDTTRLTEIINLLVKYGIDLESDEDSLRHAWTSAAQPEYGYSLSCLPPLPDRPPKLPAIIPGYSFSMKKYPDRQLEISAAKNCRKVIRETLETSWKPEEEKPEEEKPEEEIDGAVPVYSGRSPSRYVSGEEALALRYYDLFENLSGGRDKLHVADDRGHTPLNMLARWGFVDLLSRLCTRETAAQLDSVEWTTNSDDEDPKPRVPLIISACERELPNMDVLKLLVEDFGVDINAKRRNGLTLQHDPSDCNGALHSLASGNCWWHTNEALPYLIRAGADINIRSKLGHTPLIVALKSRQTFSNEAAKTLIEAGADVNAVDNKGSTCLSIVMGDPNMTKFLLANGARVSPSALLSALKLKKLDVLETLLSHSEPSIVNHLLPEGTPLDEGFGLFTGNDDESTALPLLYIAILHPFGQHIGIQKQMMEALLKHGADPYSTFQKRPTQAEDGGSIEDPENLPVTTATLIHELLSSSHIFDPIFNLPFLDIECRDENGCTLILAASKSSEHDTFIHSFSGDAIKINTTDPLPELIKRGANVMAQDNEGRTILHHIGSNRSGILGEVDFIREALQSAITTSPNLVHQTDNINETALHNALRERSLWMVEFLLDNGADLLEPDSKGNTGLHHLANIDVNWESIEHLVKRFVKAGVDINARNETGETALFNLFKRRNEYPHGSTEGEPYKSASFEYFIKCGADVFSRSNDESTLLHLIA